MVFFHIQRTKVYKLQTLIVNEKEKMILVKWLIGYKKLVKLMVRNKSWKKYEFNLIWVGMNDYFFFPPMGDKKQVQNDHIF
jgi:hypothetical protein